MELTTCTQAIAEANNHRFDREVYRFLRDWVQDHRAETLLQFDQPTDQYLANDALRDFFLNSRHPVQMLLKDQLIAAHLGRGEHEVYFDQVSGDPLLSPIEQRIYNLARRMDSERMHVPFRSVQSNKQTEAGDTACITTYPEGSEELRYNSGNHFTSRPANDNVFFENSKHCMAKSEGNLHVVFKRGFLTDRLLDIKEQTAAMGYLGETQLQFFVICSRHSLQEGHFGTSLVIMDPAEPHFPKRVMVCDTLLKELPQHPRWWHHFIAEYVSVFGDAVSEIVEDLSHPLQKVNIKGDNPYNHDWDCPYYVTSMTNALADLVRTDPELMHYGDIHTIHQIMKTLMPDYYDEDCVIKDRAIIKHTNRLKRWKSGRRLIEDLVFEMDCKSSFEL